jgi:hypothetical protein
MKNVLIVIFILAFISGCKNSELVSPIKPGLKANFTLTDTSGKVSSEFKTGEPFDVSFSLTNTTQDTLKYDIAPPMVSFKILQGNKFISNSFLGCTEPNIFVRGVILAPGKSIKGNWTGPSSPCEKQMVTLLPGAYSVQVSFPHPYNVNVNGADPIYFTIVQ